MKAHLRETEENLHRALRATYRQRVGGQPPGEEWQNRVMDRIRRLGPWAAKRTAEVFFARYVWRFAPVACAILLTLAGAFLFQLDMFTDVEMARLFVGDPVTYEWFQVVDAS
jgi:hypothetical protein